MKKTVTRKYNLGNFESVDLTILEDDREFAEILAELDAEADKYKQHLEDKKIKQEEVLEPFGDRVGKKATGMPKVKATIPF